MQRGETGRTEPAGDVAPDVCYFEDFTYSESAEC
jgi:hypothetical protein